MPTNLIKIDMYFIHISFHGNILIVHILVSAIYKLKI